VTLGCKHKSDDVNVSGYYKSAELCSLLAVSSKDSVVIRHRLSPGINFPPRTTTSVDIVKWLPPAELNIN